MEGAELVQKVKNNFIHKHAYEANNNKKHNISSGKFELTARYKNGCLKYKNRKHGMHVWSGENYNPYIFNSNHVFKILLSPNIINHHYWHNEIGKKELWTLNHAHGIQTEVRLVCNLMKVLNYNDEAIIYPSPILLKTNVSSKHCRNTKICCH